MRAETDIWANVHAKELLGELGKGLKESSSGNIRGFDRYVRKLKCWYRGREKSALHVEGFLSSVYSA